METDFLIKNIQDYTVVDVRSPSEYLQGHIPSSINIPLFSDEERKIVGTIYKQEGKQLAIDKALNFVNMPQLSLKFKSLPNKPLVVYCARGGMRSASVGWFLGLLDYKVDILKGGYKLFRRWVNDQLKKKYNLRVIGGHTGVGKTEVIKHLPNSIDLEGLANHKGSVFGGFEKKQPSQEHFENLLAHSLFNCAQDIIFIEDESRFIGNVHIPNDFFIQMRVSPIIILQDLIENRIATSVSEYKNYNKEDLKNAVKKLEKKLGGKETKEVCLSIENNQYEEACRILFSYYDKHYNFSVSQRDIKSILHFDISNKDKEELFLDLKEKALKV